MQIEMKPEGRFGIYLHSKLEETGMSVADAAAAADSTYEHIRKLVRGFAYPSKYMLSQISKAVKGFDEKHAMLLVDQDKIQHRMKNFHVLAKKNPELEPIEQMWPYLTKDQKDSLYRMAEVYKSQNVSAKRAHAK